MYELREAFREAARREFAMVPAEEELDYVFSDRFERRMRRMIRAEAHGYWNLINTTAKRVAIAAAIIIMLLSTAMAIKPIRERVIKFFVDVYEEYFEIHFGEEESWDLPERIEPMVRYTLTELPEGYEEAELLELEHLILTEWRNSDGIKITLQQETGTQEFTADALGDQIEMIHQDGKVIAFKKVDSTNVYVWEQNGYIFYLATFKDVSHDSALNMIKTLKEEK